MSVKEIKEGIEKEKVLFGIKQVLKHYKKKRNDEGKSEEKKGKTGRVFVARDAREETMNILEKEGIEFSLIKKKQEMTKELNLDFESEVFLLK